MRWKSCGCWRRDFPIAAGLLLALALVKPTISAPFAILFLAERREQVRVVGTHGHRRAVEDELDGHALHFVKGGAPGEAPDMTSV